MLDFLLIRDWHPLFFGVSFVVVYAVIALLLQAQSTYLRAVPHRPGIYFAGGILLGVVSLLAYFLLTDEWLALGMLAASFVTLVIGIVDENTRLSPLAQLVWQVVIAVVAVSWGWEILHVSHPFAPGVINLSLAEWGPWIWPGSLLTVGWLLLLMNAFNWLDGTDGLAPGVGLMALLTLAVVSLLPSIYDERTLTLALIGAGGVLGVLVWNFPPARVYLGTTGSWFLGLYVGLVAIVGGGKVVTTLLVLALPVLDLLFVVVQRLLARRAPWQGDQVRHLHFRLQRLGWSDRVIAVAGMVVTAGLGLGAVLLQTRFKLLLLVAAAMLLAVVISRLGLSSPRTSREP